MPQASPALAAPKRIELPCSSTRLQKHQVFVRIVTSLHNQSWGAVAYEGKIYRPKQVIDLDQLPCPAVAIECAGPQGTYRKGSYPDVLYIVWQFDFGIFTWKEIARAQSPDWQWTTLIREAVRQALFPTPDFIDIIRRGKDVAADLVRLIDSRLEGEIEEVRKTVLHSVYEQVAGRIVEMAS